MGLVFRDVKPHYRSVLRKWLLMAMQLSQPTTLQGVEDIVGPAIFPNVELQDVDRIEVVSGPGGSLWGANAVNGERFTSTSLEKTHKCPARRRVSSPRFRYSGG